MRYECSIHSNESTYAQRRPTSEGALMPRGVPYLDHFGVDIATQIRVVNAEACRMSLRIERLYLCSRNMS